MRFPKIWEFKSKILIFVALIVTVIISQIVILKPHLEYGFSDVDWGFLSIYKTQNPYSVTQFIKNFKIGGTKGGVYTHQIYYIGIQNDFFGLNFKLFQITTHIFKTLAIFVSIPLFLAISGSLTVTFISTILFAFSYSAVGTMYTVVTSSDYLAIFSLGIFVSLYWYIVKKNTGNLILLFAAFILMFLTLFLSTERMYPLPLFVGLTEIFLLFTKKTSFDKNVKKRILVLLTPVLLFFFIFPSIFLSFVSDHGVEIIQRVVVGNWNLLLTPFIALGSIIAPHDFIKYLGTPHMENFWAYLEFFISGPLIIFTFLTITIGIIIFKRPNIFIIQTLVLFLLFSILVFVLGSHFVDHLIAEGSIVQAIVGFFVLAIAFSSLKYWIKNRERLVVGLFIGPLLSFLYIFLTLLGSATSEVFAGVHRYLTIPAQLMGLFLGTLFGLVFIRFLSLPKKYAFFRIFIMVPFILLIIFIKINAEEIQAFFNSQLTNGFGAADKQMMRNQLLSYLDNLSIDKPSLIYFDFTQDNDNGYYYDNTLLGGLGSWILWHKKINFNEKLVPTVFWNNKDLLKASIVERVGRKGFLYNKTFFKLEDFYAFKLKNKIVYDFKEELLSDLGF